MSCYGFMFRIRKEVLFTGFLLAFLMGFAAAGAYAANEEGARQFVDEVGKQVLETVNSTLPEPQKQQQLQQLFAENVNMEWMGRFVLGNAWKQASQDQRQRYLQVYRDYLLARYTTNFSDYTGSKYTITGAKQQANGQYTVEMEVKSPHAKQQETQAGYRVRASDGGEFKIIDIIIEGVSLITTQRSEFASVVQRSGMDGLIEQLRTKAQVEKTADIEPM